MTSQTNDPMLHTLRRLTVLEPGAARSERVRQRCRTTLAERQLQPGRSRGASRSAAVVLESGLTYGVSVGYLFAMINDLLRVYMRR